MSTHRIVIVAGVTLAIGVGVALPELLAGGVEQRVAPIELDDEAQDRQDRRRERDGTKDRASRQKGDVTPAEPSAAPSPSAPAPSQPGSVPSAPAPSPAPPASSPGGSDPAAPEPAPPTPPAPAPPPPSEDHDDDELGDDAEVEDDGDD